MAYDRLSALIQRFAMTITLAGTGDGNMRILGDAETSLPTRVFFMPSRHVAAVSPTETVLFEAHVDWGGEDNPLLAAMPSSLALGVDNDDIRLLVQVFLSEAEAQRCGAGIALCRLAEVLMIRILRAQIEAGSTQAGLIAGLADPRISRAIVVMHDAPARDWRNEDLAVEAGMSLSRFSDVFKTRVGKTPQAYLRQWRLTLSRQDIARGERVQSVARRYGYGSPEALTHAFTRQFGISPANVKRNARGA